MWRRLLVATHSFIQFAATGDRRYRRFPIDTRIGDALATDQPIKRLREFLCSGEEVAFQHRADDRGVSRSTLADDFLEDFLRS